jgi:hypothetical protein
MKTIKEIKDLSYEQFCLEALQFARDKQHLSLVDSWEKYILFKDFHASKGSYYADIYMLEEIYTQKTYSIAWYRVMYFSFTKKLCFEENHLYRDLIQAITKFENEVVANPNRFFLSYLPPAEES